MTEAAEIQEKAPKPQGLLPKNVQSWLLVALAFLMVAIMWLTGGKKPPAPTKTPRLRCPRRYPWKSTKPRSTNCKAGSSSCNASNLSHRALSPNRRACSGPLPRRMRKRSSRKMPPAIARPAARRSYSGRAEKTGLHVSVFLQCGSDVSQDAARRALAGTRINNRRPDLVPVGPDSPQWRNS